MSTTKPSSILNVAFGSIPDKFKKRIIDSYLEVKRRHSQALYDDSAYDIAGLSAGKFCESVLRFLQYNLTGLNTPFGRHIPNFIDECQKLYRLSHTSGIESLRVIIPRALVHVYTIRGKRGIGHVGGDVEANKVDSMSIVSVIDWISCELIRIFHNLSLEEAQSLVNALATRNIPAVWEVMGKKRVLKKGLDYKQQVLLLTYNDPANGVFIEDLYEWTEYSDFSMFKKSVIVPMHKKRLVEYDKETDTVIISPLGIVEVEQRILSEEI